jgi:hypothetical protein
MFLNFGSILFATTLVFYMRWMASWETLADSLNFWMRIIPPYVLGESINFDANFAALAEFRENTEGNALNLDTQPWVMENLLGSVVWIIIHFVFWFSLLIAIENGLGKGVAKCFLKCQRKCSPFPEPLKDDELNFNEDIVSEEKRIATPSLGA